MSPPRAADPLEPSGRDPGNRGPGLGFSGDPDPRGGRISPRAAVSLRPLVARTRPLDPRSSLLSQLGVGGCAWLRHGTGFVTRGVAARVAVSVSPDGAARAATVLSSIGVDDPLGLALTGPLAVGALPFAEDAAGELVVPAVVVGRGADGTAWVTLTGPDSAGEPGPGASPDRVDAFAAAVPSRFRVAACSDIRAWQSAVGEALVAIGRGELAKVVLAREVMVEADAPFRVAEVLERLARSHPTCYTYAVGGLVGSSPELLVRRYGERVVSQPMAGTVARGASPEEDARLVAELAASAKDAAEHRWVVEAVCSGLRPVCDAIVAGPPEVVRLATVAHLATTVSGRLKAPAPTALALAALLHPTPAVAGTPRDAALAAIGRLEAFDRGRYAGLVGWVNRHGDGEWAVALRGAEINGRQALLRAGAGIVTGSDPDAEWAETQAKLQPILAALVRP